MRLSIITIALNNPVGLAKTLASTAQLFHILGGEVEQIVVDSSPEEHAQSCRDFGSKEQIRWIQFPPSGIYAALNQGTRLSKGSIVWHLHSGDLLVEPSNLLSALSLLETTNNDLLISSVELAHGSEFMFVHHHARGLRRNLLGLNSVHHQGALIRREVFEKVGYFDSRLQISGDYEFFIRAANVGLKSIEFKKPFVRYDTSGRSLSNFSTLYSECFRLRSLLQMKPLEKIISFINLHYHALRVLVLTPLLKRLGFYHFCRKIFYRVKRSFVFSKGFLQ